MGRRRRRCGGKGFNYKITGLTKNLVIAITACVLGSSFQFGYNTGVVNSPEIVIRQFYNETYFNRNKKYLGNDELTLLWAITVSLFTVGGMVGGVSAGYWGNRFGRKGALVRNNIIAVVAAALMGFSKEVKCYESLMVGRFICGVNSGINTGLAPLYLSEIAPVALRGLSGTFNQLAITVGALISQILGMSMALGTRDLWPLCLGVTVVPVIFQLLMLSFCPETPRFLMLARDDKDKAKAALIWLRRTENVSEELNEMQLEKEEQKKVQKFTVMDLFRQRELRIPLFISLVLQLSQQFSGINAVIMYSTGIFMDAGLTQHNAQLATVGTAVVNTCMTFVSAMIVDRAGRRTLHLIGLGGMFIFSIVLSVTLMFQHSYSWLSYVCIFAATFYIISFATGPGAIPWFYVAELFAQGPRSAAVSIAVLVNWSANFVVSMVFPIVQDAIQEYSFLPFVVMLAGFWLFTFFKVPETKGKTFEEISSAFRHRSTKVSADQVTPDKPLINEAEEEEEEAAATAAVEEEEEEKENRD